MSYTITELKECIGLPCVFNNSVNFNGPCPYLINTTIIGTFTYDKNTYYVKTSLLKNQLGYHLQRVIEIPIYDKCKNTRLFKLLR